VRTVHPFPPVADENARLLILGTMPSPASMRAGGYYGHPRNGFWEVMSEFVGRPLRPLGWDGRYVALRERGIALWDVLAECVRRGSLDSEIRQAVPNDFRTFFDGHRQIVSVFFNGLKAHQLWHHVVLHDRTGVPEAGQPAGPVDDPWSVLWRTLPSTSPARATPLREKIDHWLRAYEEHGRVVRIDAERKLAAVPGRPLWRT